ncbi:MAG: 2-oxoglutarate dehydrogenase E1 component [Janthinobacterium lividum]
MTQKSSESFFVFGTNADFVEGLYESYLQNPTSVDESWQHYFANLGPGNLQSVQESIQARQPIWEHQKTQTSSVSPNSSTSNMSLAEPKSSATYDAGPEIKQSVEDTKKTDGNPAGASQAVLDSIRVLQLIRAYRVRGHLKAQLDPLGLAHGKQCEELDPAYYGFGPQDFDRPIFVGGALGYAQATLHQILTSLHQYYCGSMGFEYMHIQSPEEKNWIEQQIEAYPGSVPLAQRQAALYALGRATTFEKFLQTKFPGAKRFGLEGGESMIPALEIILSLSGKFGVREVVLGMAHRGRLNVLTNIMGKPARSILSKFQGNEEDDETQVQGSGDVKYHLGCSGDRDFDGTIMHLSLTSNPSHLEAVDPVVIGKVRAKQKRRHDVRRVEVLGLLIHGDASLAGQGLVAETLDFSDLRGYKTGGTIHFVINNQIGFTTSPQYSRSSAYCTDVAKKIQAPIFHVNGDDVDAVIYVSQMAANYRAKFQRDVFVDLVCYRRFGHNEMDEPSFTQPLMYKAIRTRPSVFQLYGDRLIQEKVIDSSLIENMSQNLEQEWQQEFTLAQDYRNDKDDWLEGAWVGLQSRYDPWAPLSTGIDAKILNEIGSTLVRLPENFALHPRLTRLIDARKEMLNTQSNIDWATAEALAFGSLLMESYSVRLSGQDSGRGTFSQRHAVLYDQETGQSFIPLNNVHVAQAEIEVVDSSLSETGVLGFEHGYSLADPNSLVLWEAQFGDFANGAQVIVDQFISAGEAKWLRLSGLVMLLPHGYEGQGPEHSSARLERYLQLCSENNMQVANCSTPANYFHILRRQMKGQNRKPLILMTPKSLLRHRLAVSSMNDMAAGTAFAPVLGEVSTLANPDQIRRVILCSGKVYYDLYERREKAGIQDIAILRLEQFYPFPEDVLKYHLSFYMQAEIIWCQEEPANMGAWNFLDRKLEDVLRSLGGAYLRPSYVGRPAAASTATGLHERHEKEQKLLVDQALKLAI